jgi:hypothetical protein
LISVDLPAFGRPMIASLSGASGDSGSISSSGILVAVDEGTKRFEQVDDAIAMLRRERNRIAKARAPSLR